MIGLSFNSECLTDNNCVSTQERCKPYESPAWKQKKKLTLDEFILLHTINCLRFVSLREIRAHLNFYINNGWRNDEDSTGERKAGKRLLTVPNERKVILMNLEKMNLVESIENKWKRTEWGVRVVCAMCY